MGRVKQRNTGPEVALRRALWQRGLRYRLHLQLPGHPDIVFTQRKIVVFVDGCFWHGCPLHGTMPKTNQEYWAAKIARNIRRDAEVDQTLRAMGWRVVHVWEHEIKQDLEAVSERIDQLVKSV
ncbi:very short patch repair endonuclease [Thiohalobacter thiocyanaticus]|nr:very short patch repair endonuclease [Thiohalobacter thiocyanaticus]